MKNPTIHILRKVLLIVILGLGLPALGLADEPGDDGGVCGYRTLAMFAKYVGEEREGGYYDTAVAYLNKRKREVYRVSVRDGLLIDSNGFPIDAESADFMSSDGAALYGIYAMDACGRIYLSFHHFTGEFHHSSFLAGAPIAGAGEMLIIDGQLLELNNSSGHYRPPVELSHQVVTQLELLGVDMSMAIIEMIE